MVWLHGGGNATGSANDQLIPGVPNYDGAQLRNAAPRDVVVVSVNYRLGPLGFLAHPSLSKESSEHVSGNYGPAHSVELVWVWDLWSAALGAPEVEAPLVAQTANYWTALAETGDPNREGSPSWPKYVAGEDQELTINLDPQVARGRRDARCELWSKSYAAEWGDDWAE